MDVVTCEKAESFTSAERIWDEQVAYPEKGSMQGE